MSELFPSLLQTDQNGLIVVVLLCAWAVFIVKGALPHPLFVVVLFPGFVFATLAADVLLRNYGLQPTSDKAVNLAFATGTGVMVAFGVFATLCWLVSSRSRSR
jgi:hypothetical protein